MTESPKPKPPTQSITIKDVPSEYVELFNALVNSCFLDQKHTSPKINFNDDMPKATRRTLVFCELTHQMYDTTYSTGAGDGILSRFLDLQEQRHLREITDSSAPDAPLEP